MVPFWYYMRNVLKRMKNQFSYFYFSNYGNFLVIFVTSSPNLWWIFHDNLKNKNRRIFLSIFLILFSQLRIFHESGIKTEGGRGSARRSLGQGLQIWTLLKRNKKVCSKIFEHFEKNNSKKKNQGLEFFF